MTCFRLKMRKQPVTCGFVMTAERSRLRKLLVELTSGTLSQSVTAPETPTQIPVRPHRGAFQFNLTLRQ